MPQACYLRSLAYWWKWGFNLGCTRGKICWIVKLQKVTALFVGSNTRIEVAFLNTLHRLHSLRFHQLGKTQQIRDEVIVDHTRKLHIEQVRKKYIHFL